MIDTGAERGRFDGDGQNLAHCRHVGRISNIYASRWALLFLGMGSTACKGLVLIAFPVGILVLTYYIHFVDADVPILICLD